MQVHCDVQFLFQLFAAEVSGFGNTDFAKEHQAGFVMLSMMLRIIDMKLKPALNEVVVKQRRVWIEFEKNMAQLVEENSTSYGFQHESSLIFVARRGFKHVRESEDRCRYAVFVIGGMLYGGQKT